VSKPISTRIEDDTAILPWVVADCVIREIERYLWPKGDQGLRGPNASDDLADKLAEKANTVYQHNKRFRKAIRSKNGNYGRDYLYSFMRHWVAGECLDRGLSVPASFANGAPIVGQ
jgi:hypothetical protein